MDTEKRDRERKIGSMQYVDLKEDYKYKMDGNENKWGNIKHGKGKRILIKCNWSGHILHVKV